MVDVTAKTRVSESVPDPFVGRTIHGHRVEQLIGRGGMGSVYRTIQVSLGRRAALKILPAEMAEDRQFVQRFHREAEVLSRLSHPNIVTVYDRGEIDGRPYLAMEFVEGPSLRDLLRRGPLPAADALRHVSSVLSALEHAHDRGIIHRDIKPENVLLAPGGVVKVADFGLSRLLGPAETTRLTRTQFALGTYEYMSPEQREHAREADRRSDLYATGVVLYEMLTGELPIGRFDMPSRLRPRECDSRVDRIIEKSLEKHPDQRYQRASEMATAVSALLDSPTPFAAPPPPPPPTSGNVTGRLAARLENHIDSVATIDYVLGTICHVVGAATMLPGFRRSFAISLPFFLFFILGWYLRSTARDLRRFRPTGRTAQAVIALLSAPTFVLLPFSAYSFWVLFGHRGRTYYEARGRGLDARDAARYTERLFAEVAAPLPSFAPRPPRPSHIPQQSIVLSAVDEAPRRHGFLGAGIALVVTAAVLLVLGYLLL